MSLKIFLPRGITGQFNKVIIKCVSYIYNNSIFLRKKMYLPTYMRNHGVGLVCFYLFLLNIYIPSPNTTTPYAITPFPPSPKKIH